MVDVKRVIALVGKLWELGYEIRLKSYNKGPSILCIAENGESPWSFCVCCHKKTKGYKKGLWEMMVMYEGMFDTVATTGEPVDNMTDEEVLTYAKGLASYAMSFPAASA